MATQSTYSTDISVALTQPLKPKLQHPTNILLDNKVVYSYAKHL